MTLVTINFICMIDDAHCVYLINLLPMKDENIVLHPSYIANCDLQSITTAAELT